MSFDAIRWAWEQQAVKSSAKFVLVAMADCANSESGDMLCWPSYRFINGRTGLNLKTIEASIHRLKQTGLIVDTGKRRGETGKVVVYRLNAPKSGGITQRPHEPESGDVQGANSPENGVITQPSNPPKNGSQSPQICAVIPPNLPVNPPKNGGQNQEGTSKRTSKEPGRGVLAVPGVPDNVFADWMQVRKDKKSKTLTATAVAGLQREAAKAGLTVAEAVTFCVEASWVSFNAGWWAERQGKGATSNKSKTSRHSGFREIDYSEGMTDGIPDA